MKSFRIIRIGQWGLALRSAVLGCALLLSGATVARAANSYYVAPGGSDGASGSLASPWRTVAKAVSVASAGDTVYFRAGVWNERLVPARSGTASAPITFRNYPNETPVLDGTGISFSYDTGMVDIRNNRSNIVIDGLEVRNLSTATSSKVPIGIYVYGDPYAGGGSAPFNITIRNCNVHSIRTTNSNGNAHGIIVKSEITSTITNVVISGNRVHDNLLGSSEALVVNGNVDGFEITGNTVYNNNNIGIDVIGYESDGLSPSLDYARNGVVSDNVVYN